MGFIITDKNDGTYEVKGHTSSFWFGWILGVLLLIVGFLSMFVNPIGGVMILFVANVILFANNRHQKSSQQKAINKYDANKKQQQEQKPEVQKGSEWMNQDWN